MLSSDLDQLACSCARHYGPRGKCTSAAYGHALANEAALNGGAHGLGGREEAVPVTLQQEQPLCASEYQLRLLPRTHAHMQACVDT
jgi:hypothetical protein